MANLAVRLQDRKDVFIESRGIGSARRGERETDKQQGHGQSRAHGAPSVTGNHLTGVLGGQWEAMARFRLLNWLGAHEMTVLLALVCIVAGVWGFALLADEVLEGGTQAFDQRLLLAFRHSDANHAPLGPPPVQEAARDITSLGGTAVLTLVTLIAAGFLALDGKRHMAVFLCGSVLSGLAASTILKGVFDRPRPDLVPFSAYVSGGSFPSGHSMMSAVTYLTLGALLSRSHERKRVKAYFLLVAMVLTFAVGVTRVYLGVHWPTDVLAGWRRLGAAVLADRPPAAIAAHAGARNGALAGHRLRACGTLYSCALATSVRPRSRFRWKRRCATPTAAIGAGSSGLLSRLKPTTA
jgi:undecaprenyl-diphosphatase